MTAKKQTIEEAVLATFRIIDGKIERKFGSIWQDTSWYGNQDSFNIGDRSVSRATLLEILAEHNASDTELMKFVATQQAKLQKTMDSNRIERAAVRKEARKLNESNALFDQILTVLRNSSIMRTRPPIMENTGGGTLIIQLSDLHIGETIALANNKFNTEIASKRIYKFISEAIRTGIAFNVRRCVFILTGDLINSDRREGESMSNEYNRACAVNNAFEIISGAIDFVSNTMPVTNLVSVLGNESRINKDLELDAKCFTNNFDYITHCMLTAAHPAVKCSEFGSPVERLIDVDGHKILACHGLTNARKTPEQQLEYYRAKYGRVDTVICGHLHSSLVSSGFSRSGGLPGANHYSEHVLGIPESVPSQTYYIVEDSRLRAFPVDLSSVGSDTFYFTAAPTQDAVMQVEEVV